MGMRLPKHLEEQILATPGVSVNGMCAELAMGPTKMAQALAARKSKYKAEPTMIDNIRFASKREAHRYSELKLMEAAGEIYDLRLQVPFELKALDEDVVGKYVADFCYYPKGTLRRVIEDAKGFRTPLYRWKKRHFEAQYDAKIVEV